MNLIFKQFHIAKSALTKDPNALLQAVCTGNFIARFGLPCWHVIYQRIQQREQLPMKLIHLHWWLRRSDLLSDAERQRCLEQDPHILVTRPSNNNGPIAISQSTTTIRGRRGGFSTRYEPSHDAPPSSAPARAPARAGPYEMVIDLTR